MIYFVVFISLVGVCFGAVASIPGTPSVYTPPASAPSVPSASQFNLTAAFCGQVGSGLEEALLSKSIINALYHYEGQSQCNSLDHDTGIPGYEIFTAWWYGQGNSVDFGGKAVCELNCGGTCEPYTGIDNGAPISAYPWGCKCTRCNSNGPVMEKWEVPFTTTRCDANAQCDTYCAKIDSSNPNYKGYICNWWNPSTDNENATASYDPMLSPIRWCECCPK